MSGQLSLNDRSGGGTRAGGLEGNQLGIGGSLPFGFDDELSEGFDCRNAGRTKCVFRRVTPNRRGIKHFIPLAAIHNKGVVRLSHLDSAEPGLMIAGR